LAPPYEAQRYEALLARSAPIRHRWAGPAYFFACALPAAAGPVPVTEANLDLLRPHLEDWCADVLLRQPAMMLLDQGRAVSLCCSGAVRRLARLPLYSTSWENAASRALADRMGLECYGTDLHFT
jgi:hypothetical protein